MMKRSRLYTLEGSTDSGGWSPWLGLEIWSRYQQLLDGLEVIAWKHSTPGFLQQIARGPLPVTRLHGPLGSGDLTWQQRLKIFLYDKALLVNDEQLLRLAQAYRLEVLVHEPHAGNGLAGSIKRQGAPKRIWIENHDRGEAGVGKALQTARGFQATGQEVGIMFDLAHYIEPDRLEGFGQRWQRMLKTLTRLTRQWPVGVHLPVGDVADDSLPVLNRNLVSEAQLAELRAGLQAVLTVVLEYQSPLKEYLTRPGERKKRVQARLDRIMERLMGAGII
jgi:hypothetical protein